jgi:hypothetical protein
MNQHHRILWGAGWAGLIGGLALAALGIFGRQDVLSLGGGYGLMLAGSAVYLLGGLKLREALAARRARPTRIQTAS